MAGWGMPLEISLVAVFTPRHIPFRDQFERTFQNEFLSEYVPIEVSSPGKGNFGKKSWYEALRKKVETTREHIPKHEGKILIASDVDIQFFKPVRPVIEAVFADAELDIAFQAEGGGDYNTGFVVIRCSPRTIEFYDRMIASDLERDLGDQTWINDNIKESGIKHRALPRRIWAFSNGGMDQIPDGIVLHHANCTVGKDSEGRDSFEQKIKQLADVRRKVEARQ